MNLDSLNTLADILVKLTLVLGAIAAAVKFKIFRLYERRYATRLSATHSVLADGKILFEADYRINNTGQRPIEITEIDLSLFPAMLQDSLVFPDDTNPILNRTISGEATAALRVIEAGESTTFTLRCVLDHMEDTVFVRGRFRWRHKRLPGDYLSLYVKARGSTFSIADK